MDGLSSELLGFPPDARVLIVNCDDQLPPGLSEWAVHPGTGAAESRDLDDGWRVRRTDHEFLTAPQTRELFESEGIVVTDYRGMQDAWSR
ncbi:hypothetical protein [Kitasatospora sp. NPDC057223]|uniref:hypothetical protein n=1 Tax=Kitasatospora sp. NPDC057223 TaxID=3346055 RepID=UPI00362D17F0